MTDTPKIQSLVVCQNDYCAEEVSYPLDMVKKYEGQPICPDCYADAESVPRDGDGWPITKWCDLPPVQLSDLTA